MAGHLTAGRNSFLQDPESSYLLDEIEFIYSRIWKDKAFLHQKYILEGRSIAQIAREILSSRATVRSSLIQFGIKPKSQGKPGLRPAQVPYGYRMSNGLMTPHLGEQRVIAAVKKMVEGGLSYRKVCEFLSAVGVPTKNRGIRWHPEMIRRLISHKLST